jgi:hypothetical protein
VNNDEVVQNWLCNQPKAIFSSGIKIAEIAGLNVSITKGVILKSNVLLMSVT